LAAYHGNLDMARIDDGRNLLFGILALQNWLVDQADLVAGFQNWAKDRSRPFSEVLIERGSLSEEGRVLLDGLVRMHPKEFGPGSRCSVEWNCCRMGPFAFSIPENGQRGTGGLKSWAEQLHLEQL
jgi:hypothetical protein